MNKRAYHKARNNLKNNGLTFKSQVIATVSNVVNLYWDLVQFNEDLKVKQQALQLNTQLYQDNQKRAELGAIAFRSFEWRRPSGLLGIWESDAAHASDDCGSDDGGDRE